MSLQLKTFFALSKEKRNLLPPVLLDTLLHKCANIIQKGWRSSWIYRKNMVIDVMDTTFTSHFCQKYMYEELFQRDVTIQDLFYFLHEFFKNSKESYTLDNSTLHNLMSIITKKANGDSHNIFCILYGIIQYPDKVSVDWKTFKDILTLFSTTLNNEFLRFYLSQK